MSINNCRIPFNWHNAAVTHTTLAGKYRNSRPGGSGAFCPIGNACGLRGTLKLRAARGASGNGAQVRDLVREDFRLDDRSDSGQRLR
jgi:hypothetical protein